jgi:hypothetical protein
MRRFGVASVTKLVAPALVSGDTEADTLTTWRPTRATRL